MPTKKKVEQVEELTSRFKKNSAVIFADYRGLTVAEIRRLRNQIRPLGGDCKVAKNTLTKIAIREAGRTSVDALLEGPTAVIFASDQSPAVAKMVQDFAKEFAQKFSIKGGLWDEVQLTVEQVGAVANLPSRNVLLAQMLGTLQAPARSLLTVLSGNARNLMYVLQARARQLSEPEDTAA